MRFSYRWMSEFVKLECSAEELASKLTAAGIEVTECSYRAAGFDHIVIGNVLKKENHPESDHLSYCQVDIGSEILPIVCGAPNVAPNQIVAVACIGAVLDKGIKIKKSKIRGIESHGMICSSQELGLSDDHHGILVLPDDFPIGKKLGECDWFNDYIFEVEITANRGDLLCIQGIAREISALFQYPLIPLKMDYPTINLAPETQIKIEIDNPQACPRYSAQIIRDVTNCPSPFWLKTKIEIAGIRPINTIVDITNLVMLELGQPLHAFDLEKLKSNRIVIRTARTGDQLTTIDGIGRTPESHILLITDDGNPIAFAGIMGGQSTEIDSTSRHIFLESAYFNPQTIYRGQKSLNLKTEASTRFYRGANPEITVTAAQYAAALMSRLAGGQITTQVIDAYPQPQVPIRITFELSKIKAWLGYTLPTDNLKTIFTPHGIHIEPGKNDSYILIDIPTYRPDLSREIDIIEEIGRIHGFDKTPIAPQYQRNYTPFYQYNKNKQFKRRIQQFFIGNGFFDVITLPMENPDESSPFVESRLAVSLLNPLSQEMAVLRQSLIPGLLQIISHNINHNQPLVKIYQIGKVYHQTSPGQLPDEIEHLTLAVSEFENTIWWRTTDSIIDFYYLKGMVTSLFKYLGIAPPLYVPSRYPGYHPEVQAEIQLNHSVLGSIGLIVDSLSQKYSIRKNVYAADFNLENLRSLSINKNSFFTSLSKFPAIERDISLSVGLAIPLHDIETTIRELAEKVIDDIIVTDVYTGKVTDTHQKSITFRLVFRAADRTLTDQEINRITDKIRLTLKEKFNIILR